MNKTRLHLLLADDDTDDRMFFREVLEEFSVSAMVTTVNDGVELISLLAETGKDLPDILFLDLNMPRKTGYECLSEIKDNQKIKHIPVIIFSTSFDYEVINMLYEKKAHYYIRKPGDFSTLREIIYKAIFLTLNAHVQQPEKEDFILSTG